MGYDADCTLSIDGRQYRGTARLEEKDLIFRGETRLSIPLAQIAEVTARGGDLVVTFGDRRATLTIGRLAPKWAEKIAHPPSRLDKLGVKAGMRVALIGIDDADLASEIASRGAVVHNSRAADIDLLFFGARTPDDLWRLPSLTSQLRPAGALWLIREKGRNAPISESASMAAGKRAGLVDVKVVSFSETHSAEKYVIPVALRAKAARPAPRRARTPESAPPRART